MRRAAIIAMAVGALAAPAATVAAPMPAIPGGVFAKPRLALPLAAASSDQAPGSPIPTVDLASDHAALNDYAAYLLTLVRQAPNGTINDSSYIATISGSNGCRGALQGLAQGTSPPDPAVRHTLSELGAEMGDDLAINFDLAAQPAFARFAAELAALRWSRVRRYIRSETRVLAITPSALCDDALLAAATPTEVPAGTLDFLKQYARASRLANAGLAGLTRLMETYASPSDHTLIARVGQLVREANALASAELLRGGAQLTAALES
jgi:hypothetical protein